MHYIDDATGMCTFLSSFTQKPPYHIHNFPQLISLATGMDIDEPKLWGIARRNRNLTRAINVRLGMRRVDEKPPEDHWRHRDPEVEAKLLDEYYRFKGWNNEGIPTKETLDALGLDYVSEDLERRGILTKDEEGNLGAPTSSTEPAELAYSSWHSPDTSTLVIRPASRGGKP